MLGCCQEYFTKSDRALGQALAVPDVLMFNSIWEWLSAEPRSRLSSGGGGSRLVQQWHAVSRSLCNVLNGLRSRPGCVCTPSTRFFSSLIFQCCLQSQGDLPQTFLYHLLHLARRSEIKSLPPVFEFFPVLQHGIVPRIKSHIFQSPQT